MTWMDKMINGAFTLRRRFKSRKGQTLVEYALILTFISVLSISVLSVLGVQIRGLFLSIISALATVRATIS